MASLGATGARCGCGCGRVVDWVEVDAGDGQLALAVYLPREVVGVVAVAAVGEAAATAGATAAATTTTSIIFTTDAALLFDAAAC